MTSRLCSFGQACLRNYVYAVGDVWALLCPSRLDDATRRNMTWVGAADALADAEAETEVWEPGDATARSLKLLEDVQWPHGARYTCWCGHQAQQHPHTDDGQLWRPCTLCECTILSPKYRNDSSPATPPVGDVEPAGVPPAPAGSPTSDEEALEEHASWLDSHGATAVDAYEKGRYFGKAEGIRLVADLVTDSAASAAETDSAGAQPHSVPAESPGSPTFEALQEITAEIIAGHELDICCCACGVELAGLDDWPNHVAEIVTSAVVDAYTVAANTT